MNLLWIDVETGGLDPHRHALLEACAVETDVSGYEVSRYTTRIRPASGMEITPEAIAVNGYSQEAWADAVGEEIFLAHLCILWHGHRLRPAGWCIGFDLSFIAALRVRCRHTMDLPWLELDHHALDLFSLAWPEMETVERPSLRVLLTSMGYDSDAFLLHRSAGDVDACIACYRVLRARRKRTKEGREGQ